MAKPAKVYLTWNSMDNSIIFTKTAKGVREATGKTSELSRAQRNFLKEVDGKRTCEELRGKFSKLTDIELHEALAELVALGFIREFVQTTTIKTTASGAQNSAPGGDGGDLDFSSIGQSAAGKDDADAEARRAQEEKARQESEAKAKRASAERAKQEAEAQARRAAEEKAKREAEELAKRAERDKALHKAEAQARREAELKLQKELEEHARRAATEKAAGAAENIKREAEEKVRKDAEQAARKLAEENTRREAEALAKREAEERVQREAKEKARQEAEAAARREAEEKRKREAADKARRDAEAQALREAAEIAKRKAEEQARREAEEKARKEAEETARREAEELARRKAEERARKEAEEQARREAEEKARREAEEKARREAEEQARREAEEKARREAEEKARQEAEERARLEAEEKARRDAEEKARREAEELARREAEEKARREAEEQARRDAEERAKREAEEKARREAEEEARKEAEAQARRAAEEKARQEAEALAQREAEERAKREAEEQARREAAELARREVEEKAQRETEDKARKEAEKKAQREAEEQSRLEAEAIARQKAEEKAAAKSEKMYGRRQVNWPKVIALGAFVLLALIVGLIHVIPFNGRIPKFEAAANEVLQQPVHIGSIHLSLFPRPHWLMEDVSIGAESQVRVKQIKAVLDFDALFSDRQSFGLVQFSSPALGEEGLKWLLFGKARAGQLHIAHISVVNGKLDSQNIALPPFDAKAELGPDGNWQKIIIFPSDKSGIVELQPEGDRVKIEINADTFVVPFGATFTLGGFTAKGTVGVGDLTLSEFDGRLLGGFVSGNARLKWATNLSLDGELSARQIDGVQLASGFLESGKVEGKAVYSLHAQQGTQLFAAPHMEGSFVVQQGVLLGVDLMRLIKGGGSGDKTSFSELSGNFVYDSNRLQLPKLRLGAGILSANGSAEMDKNKNIRGRLFADFKSSLGSASSSLNVSGTVTEPRFAR